MIFSENRFFRRHTFPNKRLPGKELIELSTKTLNSPPKNHFAFDTQQVKESKAQQ
jgi:hypothetical protein